MKYFTFNNFEGQNRVSNFEEGNSKICRWRCKNAEPNNFKPLFKVVKMFVSGNFLNKSSSPRIVDDVERKISPKGVVKKEKTEIEGC